jgi:hypothetical protein
MTSAPTTAGRFGKEPLPEKKEREMSFKEKLDKAAEEARQPPDDNESDSLMKPIIEKGILRPALDREPFLAKNPLSDRVYPGGNQHPRRPQKGRGGAATGTGREEQARPRYSPGTPNPRSSH